jgi:hypothetical protein
LSLAGRFGFGFFDGGGSIFVNNRTISECDRVISTLKREKFFGRRGFLTRQKQSLYKCPHWQNKSVSYTKL